MTKLTSSNHHAQTSAPFFTLTMNKALVCWKDLTASGNVLLRDVEHLIGQDALWPPLGYTNRGLPFFFMPNSSSAGLGFTDDDLRSLFNYYLTIIPKEERVSGFALLLDHRHHDWCVVQCSVQRFLSLFPGRIQQLILVHHQSSSCSSKVLLTDQKNLDCVLLSSMDELRLYLSRDENLSVEEVRHWVNMQAHVEALRLGARRFGRQLVPWLNACQMAQADNRSLRRRQAADFCDDLEAMKSQASCLLPLLQCSECCVLQLMFVKHLLRQFQTTHSYLTDAAAVSPPHTAGGINQAYIHRLDLDAFDRQCHESALALDTIEVLIEALPSSDVALDTTDHILQSLALQQCQLKELDLMAKQLVMQQPALSERVRPACLELRLTYQRLEQLLSGKRSHSPEPPVSVEEAVAKVNLWCDAALQVVNSISGTVAHFNGDLDPDWMCRAQQLDAVLSQCNKLPFRRRCEFESYFNDDIRDNLPVRLVFDVDDALERFDRVSSRLMQMRHTLTRAQNTATSSVHTVSMSSDSDADLKSDGLRLRRFHVINELVATERAYIQDLEQILAHYRDKLMASNLTETRQNARLLFGNMDQIHAFHSSILLPELERCGEDPGLVARAVMPQLQTVRSLYTEYCQGMGLKLQAIESLGGEKSPSTLHQCQSQAGHTMPLSSYLLKPIQRLTKYHLLIKDLLSCCGELSASQSALQEALNELLCVVRIVNDNMDSPTINGLPNPCSNLGVLIAHEVFHVTGMDTKSSQMLFRSRGQRRHVFLYEQFLVFTKLLNQKSKLYQFKMCLPVSRIGILSVSDKKIQLWIHGSTQFYTLETKSKEAKDKFAPELRKTIKRQLDDPKKSFFSSHLIQSQDTNSSTACSSESEMNKYSPKDVIKRSRSLESGRSPAHVRSRSLDGRRRLNQQDEAALDQPHYCPGDQFIVLADYAALTAREIHLMEDDIVELVKIGCSGWWYVRTSTYPYSQGWAPSTYLEKLLT